MSHHRVGTLTPCPCNLKHRPPAQLSKQPPRCSAPDVWVDDDGRKRVCKRVKVWLRLGCNADIVHVCECECVCVCVCVCVQGVKGLEVKLAWGNLVSPLLCCTPPELPLPHREQEQTSSTESVRLTRTHTHTHARAHMLEHKSLT